MITHQEAHAHILNSLQWVLPAWGNNSTMIEGNVTPEPTGADRVAASIEAIDEALAALGKRDRAGSKAMLKARREKLATKLALFQGLGRFLRGDLADDLIDRYVAAAQAVEAAELELVCAPRESVLKARAELDLAGADKRSIEREIDSLKTRLVFPEKSIIDPKIVHEARGSVGVLKAHGNRARQLHAALEMGANARPDEAAVWIAFEPAAGGEIYELRWERFLAEHPELNESAA